MTPDDKDNPFGPPPPDDPFGPPPANDPFGRPPQGDPYGGTPQQGDPFGAPPQGDPYAAAPQTEAWRGTPPPGPDPYGSPPASRPNAENAVTALVLGILGIVFCPLCAPFAWYLGRRAEQLVDASGGTLGGRGEATAGKILGIVACALMALGVLLLIVFGVLVAAGTSSSGDFSLV